jgi:hypothetical protein
MADETDRAAKDTVKDAAKDAAKEKAAQAAKDRLAAEAERRAKQSAEMQARNKWRPTPTQEECDLVAMGFTIDQVGKADDGSGPDPHEEHRRTMWPGHQSKEHEQTRDMKPARHGVGYETR